MSAAAPAKLYKAIGGADGCHALAKAFYAQVERDPVLMQRRPGGTSARESHARFSIGAHERDAWLDAMTATLSDESVIADSNARHELLDFFTHSSAYIVNRQPIPAPSPLPAGEAAELWSEQAALDEVE